MSSLNTANTAPCFRLCLTRTPGLPRKCRSLTVPTDGRQSVLFTHATSACPPHDLRTARPFEFACPCPANTPNVKRLGKLCPSGFRRTRTELFFFLPQGPGRAHRSLFETTNHGSQLPAPGSRLQAAGCWRVIPQVRYPIDPAECATCPTPGGTPRCPEPGPARAERVKGRLAFVFRFRLAPFTPPKPPFNRSQFANSLLWRETVCLDFLHFSPPERLYSKWHLPKHRQFSRPKASSES